MAFNVEHHSSNAPGLLNQVGVFLALVLSVMAVSCAPKVKSFVVKSNGVATQTITTRDSLEVLWKVRGKPTLLVHEQLDSNGLEVDKTIELTLLVKKGKKEAARRLIEVQVLPQESSNVVAFDEPVFTNDSIIFKGIKNPLRWGNLFFIKSVTCTMNRPWTVLHEGKKIELSKDGTPSFGLQGLSLAGPWEFRSPLLPAEIADHSEAPGQVSVRVLIYYKNK